jgi:hypothetical protein
MFLTRPRAALQTGYIRDQIVRRRPTVNDDAILSSNGHLERMAANVAMKAGRPEAEIRPALDQILKHPALHSVTELVPAAALSSQAPR